MEKREFIPSSETSGNKRGRNVVIRNFWQRHAQKMSGEILNVSKTSASTSSISPAGAEHAENLGRTIEAQEHGAKGYKSNSARTLETFEAIMKGYQESNIDAPIREKVRLKEQLVIPGNPAYTKLYGEKWDHNKAELLAQRGLKPEDFTRLSADDQELIAETAEEPVIEEWLDDSTSELAQAFPPRGVAANFSVLFNRRHERMADKLNSGSEIDLFHTTHKTVTEPFLTSGVLIRKSDGQRVTKIKDLGGSLKVLNNWDSTTRTNDKGEAETVVNVRGEDFLIDKNLLNTLVEEGLKQRAE